MDADLRGSCIEDEEGLDRMKHTFFYAAQARVRRVLWKIRLTRGVLFVFMTRYDVDGQGVRHLHVVNQSESPVSRGGDQVPPADCLPMMTMTATANRKAAAAMVSALLRPRHQLNNR